MVLTKSCLCILYRYGRPLLPPCLLPDEYTIPNNCVIEKSQQTLFKTTTLFCNGRPVYLMNMTGS